MGGIHYIMLVLTNSWTTLIILTGNFYLILLQLDRFKSYYMCCTSISTFLALIVSFMSEADDNWD